MSAEHQAKLLLWLRDHMRSIPGPNAAAVVTNIDRYFAEWLSLDEAFGVRLDRGEKHPGANMAKTVRDAEFGAASEVLGEVSEANSRKLAAMLDSYYAGAWRRERLLSACPPNRIGNIEGCFWRALKAFPQPVKWQRMQQIAAAQRVSRSAFDDMPDAPSSPCNDFGDEIR